MLQRRAPLVSESPANMSACVKSQLLPCGMSASVNEKEPALLAGFDSFLPKPAISADFVSMLAELLNLKWVYKTNSLKEKESSIFTPPDVSELEKLKDLAELGKMKRIIEWADLELVETSEYRDFALYIRELAKEVNDVQIMELLEGYLNEFHHGTD